MEQLDKIKAQIAGKHETAHAYNRHKLQNWDTNIPNKNIVLQRKLMFRSNNYQFVHPHIQCKRIPYLELLTITMKELHKIKAQLTEKYEIANPYHGHKLHNHIK